MQMVRCLKYAIFVATGPWATWRLLYLPGFVNGPAQLATQNFYQDMAYDYASNKL